MQDQPAEKALSGGELIIVAIILAILSAILLPQYSKASQEGAADMPTALREMRTRMAAYRRQHGNQLPVTFYSGTLVLDGRTAWTEMPSASAVNPLNGRSDICIVDSAAVDFADGSDMSTPGHGNRNAPADVGWIVNTATGRIWATAADPRIVFNETSPTSAENFEK